MRSKSCSEWSVYKSSCPEKIKIVVEGVKIMKCIKSNERFALHGKLFILKISLLKSRAV